jgi:hypothetical protein
MTFGDLLVFSFAAVCFFSTLVPLVWLFFRGARFTRIGNNIERRYRAPQVGDVWTVWKAPEWGIGQPLRLSRIFIQRVDEDGVHVVHLRDDGNEPVRLVEDVRLWSQDRIFEDWLLFEIARVPGWEAP